MLTREEARKIWHKCNEKVHKEYLEGKRLPSARIPIDVIDHIIYAYELGRKDGEK